MRALVWHGPDDLRIETRAEPEPAAGEAVLRVHACGVCGTDLKIAQGRHRAYSPGTRRVPGHEIAAEVLAVGAGVAGLAPGNRVFVAPNLGCGHCPACRAGRGNLCETQSAFGITFDGAFADLLKVPASAVAAGNLLPVPADTDPAVVALVEPLACVLRGQEAIATGPGDLVLISGAGPIGLLHVLVALARGAERVVVSEPSARRRARAIEFGADAAVEPTRVSDVVGERGADAVLVAAPVPLVAQQAVELAAVGGRVNFFAGLPAGASHLRIDANLVHYRELVLTGTTANDVGDCRRALELALGGTMELERLVSARFPLDQAHAALAAAANGDTMKVVIEP